MGALREIAAHFGINVDTEQLEKADKGIEGFVEKLKSVAVGAFWAETAHKAFEFVEGQVEAAAHLQDLAERLDVSAVTIKKFGFAAKSAGLDVEAAAHALGFLERTMGQALTGGAEQAQVFRKLGVSLKGVGGETKPVDAVMGDLADAFAKLPDQASRAAYATKLFGREGGRELVPMLSKGREAIQDLFAEANEFGSGLGGDFYKSAKKVREEFEHFGAAISAVKERALAAILPYVDTLGRFLERVGKGVVEFSKHTTVLKSAMIALGAVISAGLVGAIGTLLAALAPFAIPVAIGLALYIVFDDLFALFTGGQSVVGDLIDEFFGLGAAAKFVEDMSEALDATIDVAEDLGDMIKQVVVGALEQAFDAAKGVGEALGDIASGNFKAAWADLKKAGDTMTKDAGNRGGKIAADAGGVVEDVTLSKDVRALRRKNRKAAATGGVVLPEEYGANTAGTGTREPETAPIPGHGGPHGAGASHVEHTVHNETNVTVNTKSDKPHDVARTTAQEVDRAHKKNAQSALVAVTEP